MQNSEYTSFSIGADDNVFRIQGTLCVPDVNCLRHELMVEAHSSKCFVHPGSTKMYADLKQRYLWRSMKMDISHFVSRCLNYQQVNAEHQSLVD